MEPMNGLGATAPVDNTQLPADNQLSTIEIAEILDRASIKGKEALLRTAAKRRRRRSRRLALRARQQGDNDGLCGFYAVINGLRLALIPHGGLSQEEERAIWRSIIRYADRNWRFASLFLGGTETRQFLRLAREAARAAQRVTGVTVTLKPFRTGGNHGRTTGLGDVIRSLQEGESASILAGIEHRDWQHWTVVAGVTQRSLHVLDSDGFHYLRLEGCQLDARQRPKGSPRYWVRIYGSLVIQPQPQEPHAAAAMRGHKHG